VRKLSSSVQETSATCTRPHKSGQFAQAFTFEGKSRTYQLYVPPAYKGTSKVPLVFDFHGFGSNAVQQMVYGNFKPEANKSNFLIVAPDGQDGAGGRHFNLSGETGLQNDLTMVQSLLTHIEATFCVNASRVYATGMSDGGAMTSLLACVAPDKFAAFAPVAVIIYCGSPKSRAVPIVSFNGTADPVVPFNGGAVHCCGGAVLQSKPVAMANWAAHDHCNPKFTDTTLGTEVVRRTWSGCATSSATIHYIIVGGGHTWPGSIPIKSFGLTTKQIDASSLIWKFFSAYTLPS
jgi:polyhydroxybutyrate depolymerase